MLLSACCVTWERHGLVVHTLDPIASSSSCCSACPGRLSFGRRPLAASIALPSAVTVQRSQRDWILSCSLKRVWYGVVVGANDMLTALLLADRSLFRWLSYLWHKNPRNEAMDCVRSSHSGDALISNRFANCFRFDAVKQQRIQKLVHVQGSWGFFAWKTKLHIWHIWSATKYAKLCVNSP